MPEVWEAVEEEGEMIYVDELTPCLRSRKWPYDKSCHLFADDIEELKIFARSILLRDEWIQKKTSFVHYDLTKKMRAIALNNGALAVDRRFTAGFIKSLKEGEDE